MVLLEAYGKHRSDLQPGAAAVLLGAVSQPQQSSAGANTNDQQQQDAVAACSSSSQLIAVLCSSLAYLSAPPAGFDQPAAAAAATAWVDELSSPAAAAALFSCWYWQQPRDPGLLLLLYSRARQGSGAAKPSLAGLLLDLVWRQQEGRQTGTQVGKMMRTLEVLSRCLACKWLTALHRQSGACLCNSWPCT
jgi:hypothetical protein